MFVHTYNDIEVDRNSRKDRDAVNDWQALMPYAHVATNQAPILEKYKCAPSLFHRKGFTAAFGERAAVGVTIATPAYRFVLHRSAISVIVDACLRGRVPRAKFSPR